MTGLSRQIKLTQLGDPVPAVSELVAIICAARDELKALDGDFRRSGAIVAALAALARVAEQEAEVEREIKGERTH